MWRGPTNVPFTPMMEGPTAGCSGTASCSPPPFARSARALKLAVRDRAPQGPPQSLPHLPVLPQIHPQSLQQRRPQSLQLQQPLLVKVTLTSFIQTHSHKNRCFFSKGRSISWQSSNWALKFHDNAVNFTSCGTKTELWFRSNPREAMLHSYESQRQRQRNDWFGDSINFPTMHLFHYARAAIFTDRQCTSDLKLWTSLEKGGSLI